MKKNIDRRKLDPNTRLQLEIQEIRDDIAFLQKSEADLSARVETLESARERQIILNGQFEKGMRLPEETLTKEEKDTLWDRLKDIF